MFITESSTVAQTLSSTIGTPKISVSHSSGLSHLSSHSLSSQASPQSILDVPSVPLIASGLQGAFVQPMASAASHSSGLNHPSSHSQSNPAPPQPTPSALPCTSPSITSGLQGSFIQPLVGTASLSSCVPSASAASLGQFVVGGNVINFASSMNTAPVYSTPSPLLTVTERPTILRNHLS